MLTAEHREKIKYLSQYQYLNKEIDRKIESLEFWKNKILNITGTLSDMPKSNKRSDTIATGIATINDIEKEINEEIKKLNSYLEKCYYSKLNEKYTKEIDLLRLRNDELIIQIEILKMEMRNIISERKEIAKEIKDFNDIIGMKPELEDHSNEPIEGR